MVDAREYHEQTNHTRRRLRESNFQLDFSNKPRPYKVYEGLPTREFDSGPDPPETPALEAIAEPTAQPSAEPTAQPSSDEASDPDLHTLCRYAAGVTKVLERRGERIPFRAAACTGK
ncbi:MAG: dehydrogenase, partial [Haloarculaceae archaeon]